MIEHLKVDGGKLVVPGSSEVVKTSSADFTVTQLTDADSARRLSADNKADATVLVDATGQDLHVTPKRVPRIVKSIQLILSDGTNYAVDTKDATGTGSISDGIVSPLGLHEFCVPCQEVAHAVSDFAKLGRASFVASLTVAGRTFAYKMNVDEYVNSVLRVSSSKYPMLATLEFKDGDGTCCGTFFSTALFHNRSSSGMQEFSHTALPLQGASLIRESRKACFQSVIWSHYPHTKATGGTTTRDPDGSQSPSGCSMPDAYSTKDHPLTEEQFRQLLGSGFDFCEEVWSPTENSWVKQDCKPIPGK